MKEHLQAEQAILSGTSLTSLVASSSNSESNEVQQCQPSIINRTGIVQIQHFFILSEASSPLAPLCFRIELTSLTPVKASSWVDKSNMEQWSGLTGFMSNTWNDITRKRRLRQGRFICDKPQSFTETANDSKQVLSEK